MRNLKKWKKHPQVFIWTLSVPNFNLKWQILGSQSCPKVFWFFGFKTPGNENFEKMKKTPPGIYWSYKCAKFQTYRTNIGLAILPQTFGTNPHTHRQTILGFLLNWSWELKLRKVAITLASTNEIFEIYLNIFLFIPQFAYDTKPSLILL